MIYYFIHGILPFLVALFYVIFMGESICDNITAVCTIGTVEVSKRPSASCFQLFL
jgi:hypothetical protein